MVLCSALIPGVDLVYVLGTVIPTVVVAVGWMVEFCVRRTDKGADGEVKEGMKFTWRVGVSMLVRICMVAGYAWLVTRHLKALVDSMSYNLFGLSIVTLTTSLSTLHSSSVKEFGMQSEDYL